VNRPTEHLASSRRKKTRRSGPRLRPTSFADHEQINALGARFGLTGKSYEDWSHLWMANPAYREVADRWDIGWVLEEESGRIVASVGNIPVFYELDGRRLLAAASHAWVAGPEYRSASLLLLDHLINQTGVDFFVTTTNSESSTPCVAALAAPVPLGDWQRLSFRIAHHRRFARAALTAKGVRAGGLLVLPVAAALWTRERFAALPRSGAVRDVTTELIDDFDERFDGFWADLARTNPNRLLAVRDAATLRWHYTALRRAGQLRVLTATRRGSLRGYCVLRPHRHPEYGINALRLLDYQSLDTEVDLLPVLLDEALRRCRAEGLEVLEHLGHGIPRWQVFDRFAPHSARKTYCPFFYHVSDPSLRARLARPEVWDPSEYDGDATLIFSRRESVSQ
jgi:hypothetical protein